jgi:hypothetical protein
MRPAQRGGESDGFETLYHLTNRRKFALDPKKVPSDNAISIRGRTQPGLYVAKNIEPWWNGHGYHRPYVAEIKVPHGVAHDERWSGEKFIPGEHMGQASVSRVIPADAWVREQWQSPGWVEGETGKAFDTGEPVDHYTRYPDYHYDGPDVRDFTPEQHAQHMQNLRTYRRAYGT